MINFNCICKKNNEILIQTNAYGVDGIKDFFRYCYNHFGYYVNIEVSFNGYRSSMDLEFGRYE